LEFVMDVPARARRIASAVTTALLAGIVTVVVPPAASATAPLGIRSVSARSAYDSRSVKVVLVTCRAGELVLSVGASVTDRAGVRVADVEFGSPGRAWAGGREDATGTTGSWLVEVTAMCVPRTTATALGLELVSATTPRNGVDKSATVSCPPGTWVAGVGGWVSGSDEERIVLDRIVPQPGLRSAGVHASADETSPPGPWRVTVQATCIEARPHLSIRQTAGSAEKVTPRCPPSHPHAIGGGAAMGTDADPPNLDWIPGGLGEKVITRYGAGEGSDSDRSPARMRSDATGFPAQARVHLWGYAVCL
jgi:hypothetical protein